MEPEQPQASVLRCVIYLAIQFPPKFSSLCSTCFQSVSPEITIHIDLLCLQFLSLQDLFLYWIGSELSQSSLSYNGRSLEGFVTMSSYGTATTLICFLASSLFWKQEIYFLLFVHRSSWSFKFIKASNYWTFIQFKFQYTGRQNLPEAELVFFLSPVANWPVFV